MAANAPIRVRRFAVAAAGILVLACSASATAQTRLHLLTSGDPSWECDAAPCEPSRVIQIDVDGGQMVASTPVEHARGFASGPGITPDGRFLIWGGSETSGGWDEAKPIVISLFELAAHRQSNLFVTQEHATVFVHPTAMRAFVQLGLSHPLLVAEPGGVRVQPSPSCWHYTFPAYYNFLDGMSGDGRRLSYYCVGNPSGLVVVESADGQVSGVVLGRIREHALDDDGRTVFTVEEGSVPGDPTVYRRVDVATGAILAERRSSGSPFWGETAYDRRSGRLFTGSGSSVLALDATTLTEIGRVEGPAPEMHWSIVVDPDRSEAYVAWWRYSEERYRQAVQVTRFNTATLAILESQHVLVDGHIIGLVLGPRPPMLSDLNVVVAGSVATLTWSIAASRSIATEQHLEVGFAPGETAVRLPVNIGATSLTVPGVPPGRYYVRVRSVNGTGPGTPSNEVVVDVP